MRVHAAGMAASGDDWCAIEWVETRVGRVAGMAATDDSTGDRLRDWRIRRTLCRVSSWSIGDGSCVHGVTRFDAIAVTDMLLFASAGHAVGFLLCASVEWQV